MYARDTVHYTGKLHYGTVFTSNSFHVAARPQLLKHRALDTSRLCPERLALSGLIRCAVWRFFCLIRCCCDLRSSCAISAASFLRPAGDSAPISPASLSSKCLKSLIPYTHQLAIDIQLGWSRHWILTKMKKHQKKTTTTRADAQNKCCHHVWRAVLSPPRPPALGGDFNAGARTRLGRVSTGEAQTVQGRKTHAI